MSWPRAPLRLCRCRCSDHATRKRRREASVHPVRPGAAPSWPLRVVHLLCICCAPVARNSSSSSSSSSSPRRRPAHRRVVVVVCRSLCSRSCCSHLGPASRLAQPSGAQTPLQQLWRSQRPLQHHGPLQPSRPEGAGTDHVSCCEARRCTTNSYSTGVRGLEYMFFKCLHRARLFFRIFVQVR